VSVIGYAAQSDFFFHPPSPMICLLGSGVEGDEQRFMVGFQLLMLGMGLVRS
jgi:hypothetical protein